ncbi:MAG: hypothetical protein E6G59_05675 [Actinobacteria bacterium]|nr:MAG: hypothetical protein E6G59_05675 [Actinomycetota bacterium]
MIKRLRKEERGAIAIMTALSLAFVIAAAAMAIDVGHTVWTKRQLQGVADMASLDAVRALNDLRDGSQTRCAQALGYAQHAATRNNFNYSATGSSLSIQLGTVDQTTKVFTMLSNCTVAPLDPSTANAVLVTVTTTAPFSFMPGSDVLTATSTATSDAKAHIGMGTWIGRFSTSNATPLDKILFCLGNGGGTCSGSAGVTALGYGGLASATINYGDLFTQLGIGSASDIANTQVSYKNFLLAAATVMSNKGDATSATALNTLAAAASASPSFKFGDLLDASGGYNSAAAMNTNLLDLVGATAELANNDAFFEVDNLGISVPGVASINMKATVIESPKQAYGGVGTSTPRTAQLRTEFDMTLTNPLRLCLVLTCVNVPLTLKMYSEGAGGTATINGISCVSTNSNDTVTLGVNTSAVTMYVGQVTPDSAFTNTSAPATVSPATLATGTVLGIPINITASNNMSIAGLNGQSITLGPGAYTRSGSVGSNTITTDSLTSGLSINMSVGVLTVSGSSVSALISPVLQAVDTSLYNVMSTLPLGIQFAGADLWNYKIDCAGRKLVG